jgi:hypothetical protein
MSKRFLKIGKPSQVSKHSLQRLLQQQRRQRRRDGIESLPYLVFNALSTFLPRRGMNH